MVTEINQSLCFVAKLVDSASEGFSRHQSRLGQCWQLQVGHTKLDRNGGCLSLTCKMKEDSLV